jgi:hypothetical protein
VDDYVGNERAFQLTTAPLLEKGLSLLGAAEAPTSASRCVACGTTSSSPAIRVQRVGFCRQELVAESKDCS